MAVLSLRLLNLEDLFDSGEKEELPLERPAQRLQVHYRSEAMRA